MIEELETLDINEVNYEKSKEGFNISIQFLVEAYLKSKGEKSLDYYLKLNGKDNIPGKLYNWHIIILQTILNEELKYYDLNLEDQLAKRNIKFEQGKLSQFEEKIICDKIAVITCLLEYATRGIKSEE